MTEAGLPDIACDVDVPRDVEKTFPPRVWIEDSEVSFAAKGLAYQVLSYPRGTVVPGEELACGQDEAESVPVLIHELEAAGYLVRQAEISNKLWLVHPDRLPQLPA
ncbi:hypothetical protein ACFT9M_04040 [Micromonospora purpureochromogenes]|uniref:hypothetical protein n=1 Tax=Micromonospora purpureochromogenes TaxID=47872 RepID=UPI003634029C